jgi:WD40 repeat protein
MDMISIDFNRNKQGAIGCPIVNALSVDRCGEVLMAGGTDSVVSIYDMCTGSRLRNLKAHTEEITACSFNRSLCTPYMVATGSLDKTVCLHDLRAKISVISQITGP